MKNGVYMKHMMHSARDLLIEYEIDLMQRTIVIDVDSIDTLLIESFLKSTAVSAVNRELEKFNKLPLVKNVNGFSVELVVAKKARFDLALIERDFEPREPTLVMKLKE